MSRPWIFFQLSKIFDNSRPQGIQVDISCQFEKIRIFLADDRLVTILEKMPMPLVPKIEIDYITGQ
jgi:hypothetical protein